MKVNKYGQVAKQTKQKHKTHKCGPISHRNKSLTPLARARTVCARSLPWRRSGRRGGRAGKKVNKYGQVAQDPPQKGKTHKCGSISHRNKSWTTACPCLNSLYVVTVTPRGALWVVTAAQRLLSCSVFSDVCTLLKSMLCFWPFSYNSPTFVLVLVRIGQNDNFLTDLHFVDTF